MMNVRERNQSDGMEPVFKTLSDAMQYVCVAFILNIPEEEFGSFERLFFTVEAAHWYYLDICIQKNGSLPRRNLNGFARDLFHESGFLRKYIPEVEQLTQEFMNYKREIPVYGIAMFNQSMEKVVMVRGWGEIGTWGFPKGKLGKNETGLQCAMREVLEETGVELSPYISPDRIEYLEHGHFGRRWGIFLVPGIPENIKFETRTRYEISEIKWLSVSELPTATRRPFHNPRKTTEMPRWSRSTIRVGKTFSKHSVAPFTEGIRGWIEKQRRDSVKRRSVFQDLDKNSAISAMDFTSKEGGFEHESFVPTGMRRSQSNSLAFLRRADSERTMKTPNRLFPNSFIPKDAESPTSVIGTAEK